MGALTALGLTLHAPERCTAVVAGAWDPADGFASALAATLRQLGLPADTDAFALLRQGAYADPADLRADYAAFFSVPDAGHRAAWERSGDVLPFLAARVPG
ncbi:hypothetical protein [Streptomyces sp. NPDC049879]|uniref:hypothetical protein n=1 Tax=Streptomyces sp. NPDC049879 TaxID=3365598 RepID=UPI00378D52B3